MRDELKYEFNRIQFTGLEGIECGDALHYVEYVPHIGRSIKICIDIFTSLFFSKIVIEKNGDGKIIFLFSNSYSDRKDLLNSFDPVCELVNSKVIIKPRKGRITWKKLRYLKHIVKWYKECKGLDISHQEKQYYLSKLFEAATDLWEFQEWQRNEKNSPKLFVAFADIHLHDSLMVQYFNQIGIDTVGMQHGSYSRAFNSWVYTGSKSKYLLVYGDFTKNDGMLCGLKEEKLIPVGMPQHIPVVLPNEMQQNDTEHFGLILNGEVYNDENQMMIELAEEFAKKLGMRYNVKLHPSVEKRKCTLLDNCSYANKIYGKEINALEFSSTIDFAIVNKTTVFYEYLLKLFPVYVLDEGVNPYQEFTWCNIKNLNDLERQYELLGKEPDIICKKLMEARNYVCKDNAKENYSSFFEKYEKE